MLKLLEMMRLTRTNKILISIYIIFLITGFLYVKKVLSEPIIETSEKPIVKKNEEKPVTVYLRVNINRVSKEYRANLKNTDTVFDLMEYSRRNKKFESDPFLYELTDFTYGTEINQIMNITAPKDYMWEVFKGNIKKGPLDAVKDGENITKELKSYYLSDDDFYQITLVKKEKINN